MKTLKSKMARIWIVGAIVCAVGGYTAATAAKFIQDLLS